MNLFPRLPLRRWRLAAAACCLGAAGLALAGDTPPPKPEKKDAAEAVQEGNVQQWIEYYQRTRPQAPPASPTKPPETVPPRKP
jgi:hypothetical protein